MKRRINLKAILDNPALRRTLLAQVIVATQAREGIVTSLADAYAAYDKVQLEKN